MTGKLQEDLKVSRACYDRRELGYVPALYKPDGGLKDFRDGQLSAAQLLDCVDPCSRAP